MTVALHHFHGGLHLQYNKEMSTRTPVSRLPLPERLYLPLRQHIGEAADPIVSPGDKVLKGQSLAIAKGYVSAPIHAPTSGTIIEIEERVLPHPSGLRAPMIVLEPDGKDEGVERDPLPDYTKMDFSELRNIIRCAGVVGLGGAVFPSAVKLNPLPGKTIETLVLNGAECEPYITCDDMLMRDRAADIVSGAKIIMHLVKTGRCQIAIEDNKPEAAEAMRRAIADEPRFEVVVIPSVYPSGSEKQLIQILTGKQVPSHGLPADVGIVCQNVGTAAAIHDVVFNTKPLISRLVTVTGEGIKTPQNVEVPIGTPVKALLDYCGGTTGEVDLIMGGPMMGVRLPGEDVPVIKATNCILVQPRADLIEAMPCIRCSQCAIHCPCSLLPQEMYRYIKAEKYERAQDFNLFDCIECGCCSWVCPSEIPLVQYYRHAKTQIWDQERLKAKADKARQRSEFRKFRIEREKAEKAAKHAAQKAKLAAKPKPKPAAAAKPKTEETS